MMHAAVKFPEDIPNSLGNMVRTSFHGRDGQTQGQTDGGKTMPFHFSSKRRGYNEYPLGTMNTF